MVSLTYAYTRTTAPIMHCPPISSYHKAAFEFNVYRTGGCHCNKYYQDNDISNNIKKTLIRDEEREIKFNDL